MYDISLVRKYTFVGDTNEIMILQFELDQREFLIDDVFKFNLNIVVQYDNSKTNWYRLKLKIDILYEDESLINSYIKVPISKGFIYQNLMRFNIDNVFKIHKNTSKLIFKVYLAKINESLKDNIVVSLTNYYENNYCNITHYRKI